MTIEQDPTRGRLTGPQIASGLAHYGVTVAAACRHWSLAETSMRRRWIGGRGNGGEDPPAWLDWIFLIYELHPEERKHCRLPLPFSDWGIPKGAKSKLLGSDALAGIKHYGVSVETLARQGGRDVRAVAGELSGADPVRHRWIRGMLFLYGHHPEIRTFEYPPKLPIETWTTVDLGATPAKPWGEAAA